jgi:predicted phage tail protein
MLSKREWEEECRSAMSATRMVGGVVFLVGMACVAALLLWPVKVASLALTIIGAGFICGTFWSDDGWGARLAYSALGIALFWLGVRLVIWAFTGVW